MKIAVIGSGYVGQVTGIGLASKGHTVICVEKQKHIVKKLNAGKPTIYEEGLGEIITQVRKGGVFRATDDLAMALSESDTIFICVGTPSNDNGIDLSILQSATREIGECLARLDGYRVIVVKSTVVPSTTMEMVKPVLEASSGKKAGINFGLCMNPEFLREGVAVEDFMDPDRIVIGSIDERTYRHMCEVYAWARAPIVNTNATAAELIKYASNTLLATLISFSNELSRFAATMPGVDIKEVLEAVHLDRRLSPKVENMLVSPKVLTYLIAGPGYGGSCFPKDVLALVAFAKSRGLRMGILDEVIKVNRTQPAQVCSILEHAIGDLSEKKIAVLGLAFKPDTDDVRESPAITIINDLQKRNAMVIVYDPIVKDSFEAHLYSKQVLYAASWKDALRDAHAAIVVTSWGEFKVINKDDLIALMATPVLFDCRRIFHKKDFGGCLYLGIGIGPLA